MNEHPYKAKDLQDYTGILTSECSGGTFKMELKLEDNPVLERSVEKIESSIELEFYYNYGLSTLFFHDIHSCPSRYSQDESCAECEKMREIYDIFESNLYHLQFGDTFKIKAALINNRQSELPVRIQSFKDYEPLTVACKENELRRTDTPEGIKKKVELEEQRLQREQDEKANQEQTQKDTRWRKRKDSIKQYFGERPNTNQIIVTVIGTTIANQIPNIVKFVKYIYRLFVSN